jgi:hypothetical protein
MMSVMPIMRGFVDQAAFQQFSGGKELHSQKFGLRRIYPIQRSY